MIDKVLLTLTIQIEIVVGVHVLQLRRDIAIAGFQRQAHGRSDVQTGTVGPGVTEDILIQTAPAQHFTGYRVTYDPGSCIGLAIFVEHQIIFQITIKAYGLGFITEVQAARLERQLTV
ncbi:hypothetical protein D3C81_1364620 [compost metagenome]